MTHFTRFPFRRCRGERYWRAGAAAGGGLLVGFYAPFAGAAAVNTSGPSAGAAFAPDAFIRIDRAGKVTLVMPQVEMGQGVYTSLSMILRGGTRRRVRHGRRRSGRRRAIALYGNPVFGIQATGNSNSVRAFLEEAAPDRCRAARAMLVEAAAAGRCGGEAHAARQSAAQEPERLQADRKAAQAARHAGQGRRQGALRHRHAAAGREIRRHRGVSGLRRQGRACGRFRGQGDAGGSPESWCWTILWPWSAITSGLRSRAWRRST